MAIDKTAFGIQKLSQDFTQLHCLYTFDIPDNIMRVAEKIGGVIYFREKNDDAVNARSENAEIVCEAGANEVTIVYSRRHPRLQPNRGLIFSPSIFCDSFNTVGAEIEYGLFNINESDLSIYDGITVAYSEGIIYKRVYSHGTRKLNDPIPSSEISLRDQTFNPALGHLFDIQGQWRGVGDFYYWLSSPYDDQSYKMGEYTAINKSSNLTTSNPALHAGYIARNGGRVRSGCFDVSSEGGTDEIQFPFQAKNSISKTVDANGEVTFLFRNPYQYKNKLNTRDIQLYEFFGSSDKKANYKVYLITNPLLLTKGAGVPLAETDWTSVGNGSAMQYIDNAIDLPAQPGIRVTGFNTTGLIDILDIELAANIPHWYPLPSPDRIPEWRTHGDIIVIVGFGATAAMKNGIGYGELI